MNKRNEDEIEDRIAELEKKIDFSVFTGNEFYIGDFTDSRKEWVEMVLNMRKPNSWDHNNQAMLWLERLAFLKFEHDGIPLIKYLTSRKIKMPDS